MYIWTDGLTSRSAFLGRLLRVDLIICINVSISSHLSCNIVACVIVSVFM